jgi:hypothetical protein
LSVNPFDTAPCPQDTLMGCGQAALSPGPNVSTLNLPMQTALCQQIHAAALQAAAHGLRTAQDTMPEHIPLARLQQQAHRHGATVYLAHPADVDDIFRGVTLAVYRAVEALYCSRLGRSVRMVWRILDAMAHHAGASSVGYEAVWAICQYLDKRHSDSCAVTIEHIDMVWWIAQTWPDVLMRCEGGSPALCAQAVITCVVACPSMQVLAFRIANEQDAPGANVSLVIHDAIVSQRRPSPTGAAGLVWRLPTEIVAEVDVTEECQAACAQMQMGVRRAEQPLPLPAVLRGEWASDLRGRHLRKGHLGVLFDNHLAKLHGHGPLSAHEQQARTFARQIGYNRDPDEVFPALRNLLPMRAGYITADGVVECDSLRYSDDLLIYWPGHQVALRQSEYSPPELKARYPHEQRAAPTMAWVYLDGEVLCRATTCGSESQRKARKMMA